VVVFAYLAHIAAGSSAVMMAPASLPPEPEADGEPDAVAT